MSEQSQEDRSVVSNRTMEISVALMIMGLACVIIVSNYRLGASWGRDGPQSGYFPFYVGMLLLISATGILIGQFRARARAENGSFVGRQSVKRVFQILIPTAIYVVTIPFLGIYLPSLVYIALFMVWLGRYRLLTAAAVSAAIVIAIFVTFEIWFLVALPKGALETWLGF